MKPTTFEWVSKAVFHFQQCAEKYLKARLKNCREVRRVVRSSFGLPV